MNLITFFYLLEALNINEEDFDTNNYQTGEDCEFFLLAWLDSEYKAKTYLTGEDYEHYELNPDIEVDEYGAMYNNRAKVLIKFLDPNLEEYWIKEGTISVCSTALMNLKNLKTIVFPKTYRCLEYIIFPESHSLQQIVAQSDCDSIYLAYSRLNNCQQVKLFVTEEHYMENPFEDRVVYNKDLLEKGIISQDMRYTPNLWKSGSDCTPKLEYDDFDELLGDLPCVFRSIPVHQFR